MQTFTTICDATVFSVTVYMVERGNPGDAARHRRGQDSCFVCNEEAYRFHVVGGCDVAHAECQRGPFVHRIIFINGYYQAPALLGEGEGGGSVSSICRQR